MMFMKTKSKKFQEVEEYISKNSGYEVPEVISINIDEVNTPYLNWLNKEIEQ